MRISRLMFGKLFGIVTGTGFGTKSGKGSGSSAARPRVRLTLEALDLRLPPSSLLGTGTDDPTLVAPPGTDTALLIAAPSTPPLPPAPQANGTGTGTPTIINFKGVQVVGGLYEFSGDVVDAAPGGLTVSFGGEPVSIRGVTTSTATNGHFDFTKQMNTNGTDNGLVTALTTNAQNVTSPYAYCMISPG